MISFLSRRTGVVPFLLVTFVSSCTYHDIPHNFDCTASDLRLELNSKANPSGCSVADGSIAVLASGGLSPYSYSLNGASFQSSNSFSNLSSSDYTILVRDVNYCTSSVTVSLVTANSTLTGSLTTTSDTGCSSHTGTIKVTATGGVTPYQYQLNANGYGSISTFSSLASGSYSVSIKDSKGCVKTISATVAAGTGSASYSNDIVPLFNTYCNSGGCHGANSGRSLTTYAKVQANAASIKSRTASGNMPPGGGLTQAQISLIACWINAGAPNN